MQLHLQVHPDSFAGYWNAAQCLAGRAAGGRRELAVPARLAAVGGDPDPAVRAVVRRAHAGAAQPGRAAAGVVRRAVDHLGARPVHRERPLLPRRCCPVTEDDRPDRPSWTRAGSRAGRAAAAQRHDLALEPPGLRHRRRGAARARWRTGCCRPGRRRSTWWRTRCSSTGCCACWWRRSDRCGARCRSRRREENFTTAARHGMDGPLYWPGTGWIRPGRAGAAQAAAAGRRGPGALGGGRRGDATGTCR